MIADTAFETVVLAAFLAFCRVGACFMVMPGLSSARVPLQVRLFIAVAVSIALLFPLWSDIAPFVATRTDAMLVLVVSELLVGGLIGLVARLYLLALQFIAGAIAMTSGFNTMGGVAIEEPEPQAALSALITFSALLLLFIFDFHHDMVRALVGSYALLPVDAMFDPQTALTNISDTMSEAFQIVLRLGSPFIAYAIIVNLAIGMVNKLTPQIPVYFVSLPFVIAGALALAYFGLTTLLGLFADGFLPTFLGG
jgi:flagellar biosynthesis protein FliR